MIAQEKFFKGLNFKKIEIEGKSLYRGVDNALFKMGQGKGFMAIEYADNEEEAKLGMFDDADLFEFSITGPEKKTFNLVREELEKHYAINAPEPY